MLTQPTRLFLPLSAAGLVLAVAYVAFTGDVLGFLLFLSTALVAGFVAVPVGGRADQPALAPAATPSSGGPGPERPVQPGGGGWPVLAALAVGLLMLSFVVGPLAAFAGLIVAAVAGVGWMARLSTEHTGREVDLLPLGLPVVGLLAIASLMFFMSRMLLAVSETGSWVLALVVAALIMATATVVSLRPQLSSGTLTAVLVVGSLLMVGGGLVAAAKGERPIAAHHDEGKGEGEGETHGSEAAGEPGETGGGVDAAEEEGAAEGEGQADGEVHEGASDGTGGETSGEQPAEADQTAPVRIVARNVAFDVDTIALKAGSPSRIELDNADDQVPHNIGIYRTEAAAPADKVFVGRIVTGPSTVTYELEAPAAGAYFFRCDVHPNMAGKVTVG